MDRTPVEIWAHIFSLACTDDGATGRALALASRWIHRVSYPYQLQSLSATRTTQFEALILMLERRREPSRRPVLHLTLADRTTHVFVWRGATQQLSCVPPEDAFHAARLILRILEATAPTLRTLALDLVHTPLPGELVPVCLPVLEELHVRGERSLFCTMNPSPAQANGTGALLPSLRRLRLSARGNADIAILEDILCIAPAVRDVYISGNGVFYSAALVVLSDLFGDAASGSLAGVRVVLDVGAPPKTIQHYASVLREHGIAVAALRDASARVGMGCLHIVAS